MPHWRAEGFGLTVGLGVALAVGGGVLAAWSAWRLLSGVRRRWWLLAVPWLVVSAYLALWTVGQAVAASFPAHPPLGSRTPADLGLASRNVRLQTSDGVTLAAWWVPSRNRAAVVVSHGAGSTRTAVLDEAAVLAEEGYGVLLFDARGHGESGGRGMDFGWYGELDTAAAVDFLSAQPEIEHIGLLGLSMGGESAIGAAGADPRVEAVVAEGATSRVAEDKAYLDEYGVRGRIQQGVDRVTFGLAGLLTPAPSPKPLAESVRAASATPFLLVTAGDVETERLAADHLREAAPDAVTVWTVPGAGHVQGLQTDPDAWARQVLGFLDGELGG